MNKLKLRNSTEINEMLNKIIDNSFGNIFVTDGEGNIIFLNDSAAHSLNCDKSELLKITAYDMVKDKLSESSAAVEVIEKRTSIIKKIKTRSGITLLVTAKPIFHENGNIEMVVVYSQNEILMKNFINDLEKERDSIQCAYDFISKNNFNDYYQVIAESDITKNTFAIAKKASVFDSIIMLYGESGSGKEVFARYIHKNSLRSSKIFIPVNCAAIPHDLMEAEFFGYEGGAFTGSNKNGKLGLFEIADGGTLFLDEIGELDLALQAKLLRVIESNEIKRVGGNKYKTVDVRLIGATNRNLEEMVNKGDFREDLYYRLNVVPITVPPLRDRKEDILALTKFFITKYNIKYGTNKSFTDYACNELTNYNWPGNVRELKNVIERIFITSTGDILDYNNVIQAIGLKSKPADKNININKLNYDNFESYGDSLIDATEKFQKKYISNVLEKCNGNVYEAAAKMGVNKSGLYKKLKKFNLK